jgi:RNA polymerase sigma factor (sigma-70 family)
MIESNVLLQQYVETHDGQAFAELARRHANLVYGVCIRILGDKDRAAEASQETFFQLVRSASSITGSISGWLHCVATRKSIDFLRKESLRKSVESEYIDKKPRAVKEWKDLSLHVDEALNLLEEGPRALVVEYFLENRSMTDIAAARDISAATVSRRINAAVTQLRGKLRGFGLVISAALLYSLLQENVAHAVPSVVVRELGKMALAGREAATGIQAATATTGAAVGLKVMLAVLGIIAATGVIVITVQHDPASDASISVPNEPNETALADASSDPNVPTTGRRMPPARHMGTPPPRMFPQEKP